MITTVASGNQTYDSRNQTNDSVIQQKRNLDGPYPDEQHAVEHGKYLRGLPSCVGLLAFKA